MSDTVSRKLHPLTSDLSRKGGSPTRDSFLSYVLASQQEVSCEAFQYRKQGKRNKGDPLKLKLNHRTQINFLLT